MIDSRAPHPTLIALSADPHPLAGPAFPRQPLAHLDALWIQVAGSRCNLRCTHCFVSCGPEAATHEFLDRATVAARVAEGRALGVREFYFTGGEPFLHPEMIAILADTLEHAPATVLTNGTLFTARRIDELRELSDRARFTLEIRVSIDGTSEGEHDPIRGAGTFERTLDGVRALAASGLLPIVTATQITVEDPAAFRARALAMLREAGIPRPRLKTLPLFRLGRETSRDRDYLPEETLAGLDPDAFDPNVLQCGRSRAVTSRGVFVCPLLVDEPGARMGESLAEALRPFELRHGACSTCYSTGMTCGND
jgi:MoaA/NifB/PqqE/SkfB family radical SAM enzyme